MQKEQWTHWWSKEKHKETWASKEINCERRNGAHLIQVAARVNKCVYWTFIWNIISILLQNCNWVLSVVLRPLIFWHNKQTVRAMLPRALCDKYPNLRTTIDCTEIFIQRPKNLQTQCDTWSDYKKHNTIKYLVAITPNGMISFVSKGWGGRTSDRHIVLNSNFLDLIDPGDVVLADRGFSIAADLLLRQAKLEIPPPSSGWEQHIAKDVKKTKRIANTRIHVERAIGRLKCCPNTSSFCV